MILKRKKYSYIDMLTIAIKVTPVYTCITLLHAIVSALIPVITIFITANFINTALAVYSGEVPVSAIYLPTVWLAVVMLYEKVAGIFLEFVNVGRSINIRKKLVPELTKKIACFEYRHMENSQTLDLIQRVNGSLLQKIPDMLFNVENILSSIIMATGIFVTLFFQVPWLALTMFISLIPLVYLSARAGRKSYAAEKEMSQTGRRVGYLSDVLLSREAVEERSIYDYSDYLNNQYIEKFEYSRKFRLKVSRDNYIRIKLGGIATGLYSVVAMIMLLPLVVNGNIDLGLFIGLIGGIFRLSGEFSWGVSEIIEDLTNNREFLGDLTEFMVLEDCDGAESVRKDNLVFRTIEFRNVSFKYPDTDKVILDNISFKIENGKHYSFVGANGAGKTTITKLITGLYDNYTGDILVDGCSLRTLGQSEIKGLSSVVYQDFARYYISMYNNIALVELTVAEKKESERRERVRKAVELVGLSDTVKKLPNGIDTPLGKIISGGIDISGGEWQRIAMARCVMSDALLKILDEPTAALDPISESRVYENFEQISRGSTTIFISHRLGSTKLADVIYVLADGMIVESGGHAELMTNNDGLYREMFDSQAQWYVEK